MRSALVLLVGLAAVTLAQDTYKCPDNWLLNEGHGSCRCFYASGNEAVTRGDAYSVRGPRWGLGGRDRPARPQLLAQVGAAEDHRVVGQRQLLAWRQVAEPPQRTLARGVDLAPCQPVRPVVRLG